MNQMFLITLVWALTILTGSAQLAWKSQEEEVTGTGKEPTLSASFIFQNKGNHTVNILEVKPSCGCTTATLAKNVYAPGEKGEIDAVLTVGSQTGTQEKSILVVTDDPLIPKTVLDLKVHLPIILSVTPSTVSWYLKSPEEPQMIKLKADPGLPVKVLSVFCDSMDIDVKLQVDKPGQEYTIIVTPLGTALQARGSILIETDYQQDGKNRVFYANAFIVPRPANKP